jgi:chromosome segregation ATPase
MSALQEQTRIGDLFVSKGLVSAEQVAEALRLQSSTGKRLGEVLVDQGLISRMDLASALQVQWKKQSAPPISVTGVAETRSYEEGLKAQLAEQEARIAELSQEVEALTAALTDREERLAVILTFLQAPASS